MVDTKTLINCILMFLAVVVITFLINRYNIRNGEEGLQKTSTEPFYNEHVEVDESEQLGHNETNSPVDATKPSEPPACYPRTRLTAKDLLSQEANTLFSQVNPSTQGDVDGVNYLTAGAQLGLNTVGTSLRNANRQLRSEPTNPQVKVSPWMMSTITPDTMRPAMEIGSGGL